MPYLLVEDMIFHTQKIGVLDVAVTSSRSSSQTLVSLTDTSHHTPPGRTPLGETKGEIVGYNCINGTNYGGMDEPLPQGARAAFLIAESEWQEVPASKGKRARGS